MTPARFELAAFAFVERRSDPSELRSLKKGADGRTRTCIDSFRRRAPDPFDHVRKLRSRESNPESLGSKPSVLPVTPLRNVGGWGRIRTGCLWWFRPALFQNELPNRDGGWEDSFVIFHLPFVIFYLHRSCHSHALNLHPPIPRPLSPAK